MNRIDQRLAELAALISAEDPFSRIPGTVYIDAQAIIEWNRLGVFEGVLDVVPPVDGEYTRFQVQHVAFDESVRRICRLTRFARGDVEAHIKEQLNLHVDTPLLQDSEVGERALELQAQMFIMEGEGAPPNGSRKHMGEAETLAVIERLDPGSIFVTADRGAIKVARDRRIGVVVRPLAFAAGVVTSRERVEDMWTLVCDARDCRGIGGFDDECIAALNCRHLSDESAERGPLSKRVVGGHDVLEWMHKDLADLVDVLAA